jgi:4-amino-4-deoxy-L-arabinose transferase-like glycosyltransferase
MSRRLALPGVVLAALVTALLLFVYQVRSSGALDWDQSAHALHGLLIASDARSGDLLAVLLDSYKQVYWPFLHSWLTAIAFLVVGPGTVPARSVSLVCFVLLVVAVFLAGRAMSGGPAVAERDGETCGLIAAVLTLTSPPLLGFATNVMLEVPALAAFVATLYARFALRQRSARPPAYWLLGAMVMITYFLKANYGLLLLMVFAADALIDARFRLRSLLRREHAYALAPVVVLSAVWFAYLPKLGATWTMLVNQPYGTASPWTAEGLLYYPRALVHLSGSFPVFVVLLVSLVAAWRLRSDPNVRLLLLVIVIQFAIGELHHTKVERHLFPVLPAMFLLAGCLLVAGWRRWVSGRSRRGAVVTGAATTFSMAVIAAAQGRAIALHAAPQALPKAAAESLGMIAAAVRAGAPALVVATTGGRLGGPSIDWYLATHERLLSPEQSGAINEIVDVPHERRLAGAVGRSPFPRGIRSDIVHALTRYERPATTRSISLGVPTLGADSAEARSAFDDALATGQFTSVVAITPDDNSGTYRLPFLLPSLTRAGFTAVETRTLADPPSRVDVFRRTGGTGSKPDSR